jgi:hypothetical protein
MFLRHKTRSKELAGLHMSNWTLVMVVYAKVSGHENLPAGFQFYTKPALSLSQFYLKEEEPIRL